MTRSILFVCPFQNSEAKTFVESLAHGLRDSGWQIKISNSGLTTFLFEPQKFDVAHFFLPASGSPLQSAIRKGSKTKIVQTMIDIPPDPLRYRRSIFADAVVTFSEYERELIRQQMPNVNTNVILPCVRSQSSQSLTPAQTVRERYDVRNRMFVVALNDFRDQEHFKTFLYTAREYQRRDGYRFLIPLYRQERQSLLWRKRLSESIRLENLSNTTLLDANADLHSLIDACDVALLMDRRNDRPFGFPLSAVEALCAGKPVIGYNIPPVNEIIAGFNEEWLVKAYEDFSRISRDLLKQSVHLEQLSTELARFARSRMSEESVAASYDNLYNKLFSL
jgi:glycosyltransferase involved in cell wall biosynthesis